MNSQIPSIPQTPVEEGFTPVKTVSHHYMLVPMLIVIILILAGSVLFLFRQTTKQPVKKQSVPALITKVKPTMKIIDTSDWKTYTDENAGFSFKYPATVLIKDDAKGSTQLTLSVSAQLLTSIPEDLPITGGRIEAIKQKARLSTGTGDNLIKIDSLYGETSTILAQFEVCSVIFARQLVFYPGEYQVRLTLTAPKTAMISAMPEFFHKDPSNCGDETTWDQKKISQFIPTLSQGQGKGLAQEWFNTFQGITESITLTPLVKTTSFITPTKTADSSLTYKNSTYGFEMTYSPPYKVLEDKDSLSGWKNGIALIYNGGQAYDISIQVWDSKAEYEQEFASRMNEISVHEVNGKFITVSNNTNEPDNQKIIDSFKFSTP